LAADPGGPQFALWVDDDCHAGPFHFLRPRLPSSGGVAAERHRHRQSCPSRV